MPAQVSKRRELPPDFYELTGDELKREQRMRSELVERELTLRTKAQRERDEMREQRLYRYAVMRIRFPDGLTLQVGFKNILLKNTAFILPTSMNIDKIINYTYFYRVPSIPLKNWLICMNSFSKILDLKMGNFLCVNPGVKYCRIWMQL